MKPLDPRLLKLAKATRWFIATVVALGILATASTVTIAWALASFIVEIFVNNNSLSNSTWYLWIGLAAGAIRAAVFYSQEVLGQRAASGVKLELRSRALVVVDSQGSGLVASYGTGELGDLLGARLDSLDVYFAKYLPQLIFTALVSPIMIAIIWSQDLLSGLTVLLTMPLIPVFMILIGLATRKVQSEQLDSLARLKGHFYEVLKGLQILKSFGRDKMQSEVLFEVSESYRKKTMRVLRISFLSGFALELAASLSVALLAVSIGLRLVEGQLGLFTGLFVLMLAPEAYLPLRNVGIQFHAAAEGVEVTKRVLDLIETKSVENNMPAAVPNVPILAITGVSGVGKSTLLASQISSRSVWMPQETILAAGTIGENIAGFSNFNRALLERAMQIARVEFDVAMWVAHGEQFSGGERQRIGLARTLYAAFAAERKLILLDEPLSFLDLFLQRTIALDLKALSLDGYRLIVVTHQESLIAIADEVINLG